MFSYCRNNPVKRKDVTGASDVCYVKGFDDNPFNDWENLAGGSGGAVGCVVGTGISCWALSKVHRKKPVNLPSPKKLTLDLEHISSGHMPGGNRNPNGNKSVFWGLTLEQAIKAIYEAYQHSSKLQTQGDSIKVVGYSETYDILIEMWINVVTYIIETAYPKG